MRSKCPFCQSAEYEILQVTKQRAINEAIQKAKAVGANVMAIAIRKDGKRYEAYEPTYKGLAGLKGVEYISIMR